MCISCIPHRAGSITSARPSLISQYQYRRHKRRIFISKTDITINALTSIGDNDTSSLEGLVRIMQLAMCDAYNAEDAHNYLA